MCTEIPFDILDCIQPKENEKKRRNDAEQQRSLCAVSIQATTAEQVRRELKQTFLENSALLHTLTQVPNVGLGPSLPLSPSFILSFLFVFYFVTVESFPWSFSQFFPGKSSVIY